MIDQTHFVLDLETYDTLPTAAIASIGCAVVKRGQIVDEFYVRTAEPTGTLSHSTVRWWLGQSAEARAEVDGSQPGLTMSVVLEGFRRFMEAHAPRADRYVWGNGPSFDNVIMRHALRDWNVPELWPYPNDRDIRTLSALFPQAKRIEFEGTRHHALHDARHEAKILCRALALHQEYF
ncbi:3'-5' exonuclease [Pseudomonas sp. Marseille-QA0892]